MRRLSLAMMSLAIASLVTMVSCEKPNIERIVPGTQHTITFNATTESNGGSKTTLNGIEVWWSSGDELSVNANGQLTLTDGAGSMYGIFEGEVELAPTYLVGYPVEAPNNGTSITFTIPAEQEDNDASLTGKIPMAAYTTNGNATLAFKNMANVLELNLKTKTGTQTISGIEVSAEENLSGSFTVGTDLKPSVINVNEGTATNMITVSKTMELTTAEQAVYVILPVLSSAESKVSVKFFDEGGRVQTVGPFKLKDAESSPESTAIEPNHKYEVPVEVKLKSPISGPTEVSTKVSCESIYVYTMGGSFKLPSGAAQVVEYGLVCSESESVPTIDNTNCFKVVGGIESLAGGTTTNFTIDITRFEAGGYYVRAYAIGESGTPVYAPNPDGIKTTRGGNIEKPLPSWNNGTNPYDFTVAEGKTVKFSQGNLQYIAEDTHNVATGGTAPGKWRFANYQFGMIGMDQYSSTHDNQTVNRDLFGWGTSGWNNGNTYYMPYNTSNANVYSYGPVFGGNYDLNLTGSYANADWGVFNAIENGGNSPRMWRTLTKDEWVYLLSGRSDAANKWGLGKVGHCIPGMIILPDNWTQPTGLPTLITGESDYVNDYSYSDWSEMEEAGAVFLPAAGRRYGLSVDFVGENGDYWSSSSSLAQPYTKNLGGAYGLDFEESKVTNPNTRRRLDGRSVRLVRE